MSPEVAVFVDWLFELWAMQYWRVAALMFVMWLVYLIVKNAALVDFGWVLNHLLIGTGLFALYVDIGAYKIYTFYGLLVCWACRLGGYLLITRVCKSYKDPRYEKMSENKTKRAVAVFFLINYQMQGFLVVICGSTLYFTFRRTDYTNIYTFVVSIVLITTGIIGEAVADQQLHNHKKNKNKIHGAIFQKGLWKRSRHPNLFFELVTWFGFAVAGINDSGIEALAFVGPLVLWAIMNYLTVPISEKHMWDTRPTYSEFVKNTNKFLPF